MKSNPQKSIIPVIGIMIILIAFLSRRLYIKNLNVDSLLSFIAGIALVIVCFVIFKKVLKNKK